MIATIRNCPSAAPRECPRLWKELTAGEDPSARRCDRCDRPVYLCATDKETVAHARVGHVIARDTPTDAELGTVYAETAPGVFCGLAWGWGTPEQVDARRLRSREQRIDDAIRTAQYASRDCPECGYPVRNYRVTCGVCGAVVGRVYGADGKLFWAGGV